MKCLPGGQLHVDVAQPAIVDWAGPGSVQLLTDRAALAG